MRVLALSSRDPVNSDLSCASVPGRGRGGRTIEDLAHTLDRLQFFRRVLRLSLVPAKLPAAAPPVAVVPASDRGNVRVLSPFQTDCGGRDLISFGSRRKHVKSNKNATFVSRSDFDAGKSPDENFPRTSRVKSERKTKNV